MVACPFLVSYLILQLVSIVCGTICAVILSKDYGEDIPVTRASGIVPKAEMYLDEWPSKQIPN